MRDPHVETLRYGFETDENVYYHQPPTVEVEEKEFEGRLEDGILMCHMKVHYPSVEASRRVVDQYLRAWEIDATLSLGRGEFRFVLESAPVIDRDPQPPGAPQIIHVSAAMAKAAVFVTGHVTRRKYPEPPKIFRTSPDVETLWQRYQNYLERREPLPSMAYFCLTIVEARARSRAAASRMLAIEEKVLQKLGELTSVKGETATARKAPPTGTAIPLSGKEPTWIEAAVKQLIRRLGEYRSGHTLPKITMADLPPLDP